MQIFRMISYKMAKDVIGQFADFRTPAKIVRYASSVDKREF